ncbi:MAG: hypothetical protein ABFR89_02425 [Actinomycetota bacterium]
MTSRLRWCWAHGSRASFVEGGTKCYDKIYTKAPGGCSMTTMFDVRDIDRQAIRDTLVECDGMDYDTVTDRILALLSIKEGDDDGN